MLHNQIHLISDNVGKPQRTVDCVLLYCIIFCACDVPLLRVHLGGGTASVPGSVFVSVLGSWYEVLKIRP